jgi:hypothetical protein
MKYKGHQYEVRSSFLARNELVPSSFQAWLKVRPLEILYLNRKMKINEKVFRDDVTLERRWISAYIGLTSSWLLKRSYFLISLFILPLPLLLLLLLLLLFVFFSSLSRAHSSRWSCCLNCFIKNCFYWEVIIIIINK